MTNTNNNSFSTYGNDISKAMALANSASEFGGSQLTQLKIVIEGKPIKHYKNFRLSQSATWHHDFALTLSPDSLGSMQSRQLVDSQKLVGKRITVIFTYKNLLDSPSRNFVGVITEVTFSRSKGNLGNIILQGGSPTVLLDDAPHMQSFGGKQPVSLKTIADTVIKEGLNNEKYKSRVEPSYTGNVSYTCQYDETHYNFLARTAEAYGEQFFYDGAVLHFGKLPPPEKPINLTYGEDVDDIQIKTKSRHVKRSLYGYNSNTDEKLTTGETQISHQSSLARSAYELSEKTFQTPSLCVAPIKASTHKDIEAAQKSTSGSMAVDVFITSGTTTVPFLYPGCLVDMNMRKDDSAQSSYLTKLMIIEIIHSVDMLGNYIGSFKAIAADTGYLPTPQFHLPNTKQQVATVTDNKDPEGKGRVQARFDWHMSGNTTEWIRVGTPDAGGSKEVGKNRGFMAIPEIGDQVLVDFTNGHPDRPLVIISLFHGKVAGGGGSGNNIKSLSSKSGHILQLNDGAGITLKDKTGGNHIVINGEKTIAVTSSDIIELTNGKAYIKLEGDEIILSAGKITLEKSGGESSKIDIKGLETTISGKTSVKIQSDTLAEIDSKATTSIKTKTLTADAIDATINGKTMVTIKGGTININ